MKNMKVSAKLIVSFLVVAILTALIGGVGIFGMMQINDGASGMYNNQTVPMSYMTKIVEMLQRQRAYMRDMIIGSAIDDIELINDAKVRADEAHATLYSNLDPYVSSIKDPAAVAIFNEARTLYETEFRKCMDEIYNLAKGDADAGEVYAVMAAYTVTVNEIVDKFEQCLEMKIDVAATANHDGDSLFTMLLTLILVVLAIVIAVAMFLAFYISRLISKPLGALTDFLKKAGSTGDIQLRPEDQRTIEAYAQIKDEIGQCISAAAAFVGHIVYVSKVLEQVANGDLSDEIKLLSTADTIGVSLQKTLENLNSMFGEINNSTAQVSSGAKQIADGSQALAQGSTQQAAAVQQLSASISEIAEKTKGNAQMAEKAATLAESIMHNAEKGSRQMDEMMTAVKDINAASQSISKVIAVIDNIAFQTNILALNAAVEAARVGQHGKGFAVVAEEVRNLATKSAEAAKDTGNLIANSMEKAELGARVADETAASLTEIVAGIQESTQLIGEISRSSDEQAAGITQINQGIDQVAQVVQQNSATAEQSAAASEEMSGQSNMLEDLIAQFKLKDGGSHRGSLSAASPAKKRLEMPEKNNSGNFGKY